jgi:hypothetical protein
VAVFGGGGSARWASHDAAFLAVFTMSETFCLDIFNFFAILVCDSPQSQRRTMSAFRICIAIDFGVVFLIVFTVMSLVQIETVGIDNPVVLAISV